jgi:hypothetical protein
VELKNALADPNYLIEEAPFTVGVVDAMRRLPREDVPDTPDRIVAATVVFFGAPAMSRDGRIRASNIRTVWSKRWRRFNQHNLDPQRGVGAGYARDHQKSFANPWHISRRFSSISASLGPDP